MKKTLNCWVMIWFTWFFVGISVSAIDYYVSPIGDDGNDCLSSQYPCLTITSAINKAVAGDRIFLATGEYSEQLQFFDRQDIRIIGDPGATLLIPNGLQSHLVGVINSRGIFFENITFTGNGQEDPVAAFFIATGIAVNIENCIIQDFGGGGIGVMGNSSSWIADTLITRNNVFGIRVDGNSQAMVVSSIGITRIQDNAYTGIILNRGEVFVRGPVEIQRNVYGILGEGGNVSTCCGEGIFLVKDNIIGISMRGGHLELRGPAQIEGHPYYGVRLVGASGSFGRFSQSRIVVTNNGNVEEPESGGVFLLGSHLDMFVTDVVGNLGHGVLLQDNSSIRISDVEITQNGFDGLRLENLSSARILDATISGNTGEDLICTYRSLASGDSSGITRMNCPCFRSIDSSKKKNTQQLLDLTFSYADFEAGGVDSNPEKTFLMPASMVKQDKTPKSSPTFLNPPKHKINNSKAMNHKINSLPCEPVCFDELMNSVASWNNLTILELIPLYMDYCLLRIPEQRGH